MAKEAKIKLDRFDVEELACKIVGLDYDEIDADEEVIEDAMEQKFGCDLEKFADMVSLLMPMIDIGESPMTKKRFKGFSDTEKQMWFVKMEIPETKKKKA